MNLYPVSSQIGVKPVSTPDPTPELAIRASILRGKMEMVERASSFIDIGDAIFKSVTEGKTFGYFESNGFPFGRDLFYDRLRKFYYRLDKIRT